jgi:hypothetical protein
MWRGLFLQLVNFQNNLSKEDNSQNVTRELQRAREEMAKETCDLWLYVRVDSCPPMKPYILLNPISHCIQTHTEQMEP